MGFFRDFVLDLSAARTLEELRRIAFGNRVSLMRCRTVADLEKLPEELQAMVADFEVFDANIPGLRDGKTDKARRVRTESKLKALEMLAKHFKLLVEQVDVNVFDWDKLAARLHGKHGLPMRRPDSHTATVHARDGPLGRDARIHADSPAASSGPCGPAPRRLLVD